MFPPPEEPRFSRFAIIVLSILGVIIVGALIAGLIALAQTLNPPQTTPTATAHVQQTFSISGQPTINVQGAAGDITVIAGPEGKVVISATKTANGTSYSAAYQELSHIGVRMSQTGNTITVKVLISGGLLQSVRADLQIMVPHQATLNLTSNIGKMVISGVSGTFQLLANVGDITLTNVTLFGPRSTIATQTGNITLTGTFAGSLGVYTLQTVNGDITLNLAPDTSFHLHAHTTNGSITSDLASIPSSSGIGADISGTIGNTPDAIVNIQVSSAGNIILNHQ